MKKWLTLMGVLALTMAFFGSSVLAADMIALKKYPGLKIGFTTQNFLQPLPPSLDNAKVMVDFAAANGFAWIEYRDPSAKLTLSECKELAAYAKARNVEIGYSIQVGILDRTFWEIFSRGLANSTVFSGPTTIRSLTAGSEFDPDPKKQGWNLKEFYKLVTTANMAANHAKVEGVQYVAENNTAALKGDGQTIFGLTELFANVNSNVGWQMDTANFFAGARVLPKPEEAKAFLEKYVGKLRYIHLKSSSAEHKSTDVLQENELALETIFEILTKNKINYVAIELNQKPGFEECANNLMKSIDFLKKNY